MASELLPCPICGGEPVKIPCAVAYPDWWRCTIVHDGNDGHYVRAIGNGDTEQEAIDAAVAAWNRRTERTCRVELIPDNCGWSDWTCSACRSIDVDNHDRFCPSCGARVVKE